MNGTIKNLLVGVFILSAITVFVAVVLFLKPSVGDGKQNLFVRFSDINNINVGTRVLFAGKPVGEVVSIEEIHEARREPTDELGRVYFYQLTLHLDSRVKVFNTDEISIQTSGLLGEKSIAITPKTPAKGITSKLVNDQPIYANSVDMIQNIMIDFSELSTRMEEAFTHITEWLKNHGEDLGHTVAFAKTSLTHINTAMQTMENKNTFQNVGLTMENIKSLANEMSQGKGTLGKLCKNDDLYLQTNAIMTKANNMMNDINHYGILFHLNKEWQRTRLQRVNLLNALNTPQSFRTYFEGEVDQINNSMSRLSMLINKAENDQQREAIFSNDLFKRDFYELMRNVDGLSENLRLYNQQLYEASGR